MTQFRISHLLVSTLVAACVFAFVGYAGLRGVYATVALIYFFAPLIAFGVSRFGKSRRNRYRIAACFLLSLMLIAFFVALVWFDPFASVTVLFSLVAPWAAQVGMLYIVKAIWKSGLRSAGVDPNVK